MKPLQTDVIISSIRSKVDKSLSLTLHTPELSTQEKALFMELQGVKSEMVIAPVDGPSVPAEKIDKDIRGKTQSQRLRGVIFVYWEQQGKPGEFEDFYRTETERIIGLYKSKLD